MTTIRDVAKYAGVSVGTVSNVLNNSDLVRTETRDRVLAAIETLNYHPTAAARSLNTHITETIGMVRTELRPGDMANEPDPFILDLIDGVSMAAMSTGTGLTFWTIPVGPCEIELYHRLVRGRQVDGLILFALRDNDPRITFLKKHNFPFVVFGRRPNDGDIHWIDVDGAYGIELAVKHLVELGHERIGYLAPPREQHLTRQRWQGFERAMRNAGLKIDHDQIVEGDFTERSGQLGMHYLLDLSNPPTAVVCNNDRMAFGAMRAIQARGLSIGSDVSVVGFDDVPLARYWHPPLTTLYQPTREIGGMLFSLLQAVIAGQDTRDLSQKLIKPELRVRSSTGNPVS
jgi:LacI family transcriptional regulator